MTYMRYPTRPVRIVVGVASGSAPDIFARLIAQWLSDRIGQQFVVENRPGAGTNIATETVVRASPDGYTLLLVRQIHGSIYDGDDGAARPELKCHGHTKLEVANGAAPVLRL